MSDEVLRYFTESAAMLDMVRSEIPDEVARFNRIYLMDIEAMLEKVDPDQEHVITAMGCIAYWQSKLDEILAGTADRYTCEAYNFIRRPRGAEHRIFSLSMLISYQKRLKNG